MKGEAEAEMWERSRGVDLMNERGKNVRLNEKREPQQGVAGRERLKRNGKMGGRKEN